MYLDEIFRGTSSSFGPTVKDLLYQSVLKIEGQFLPGFIGTRRVSFY